MSLLFNRRVKKISTSKNRKVISPCVGQCRVADNDMCMGCYRLISEIGGWLNKPDSEKRAIVDRCSERKKSFLEDE